MKIIPKRKFDSNSSIDLMDYMSFRFANAWVNGCPFRLEWPYVSIPEMCKEKIIETHLSSLVDTLRERVRSEALNKNNVPK